MNRWSWGTAGLPIVVCLLAGCASKKEAPAEQARVEEKVAAKSGGNQPPVVKKVEITPEEPKTADSLEAVVEAVDAEGDHIEYRYQWYVNGESLPGELTSSLRAEKSKRGDQVTVEVWAKDDRGESAPRKAEPVQIANTGPVLVSTPSGSSDLDGLKLEVSDADGDPIKYRLEGAAPNMSLDASGVLHYKPTPSDAPGNYDVSLIAEDSQGASVTVKIPVSVAITPGSSPAPVSP